jgi:tetratricopeptide (TPR) repeat protein
MRTITTGLILAAVLAMAGNCFAADTPAPASGVAPGKIQWYTDGKNFYSPAVAKLVSDGIALINKEQWAAAIEKFNLALKEKPDGASIYENRGFCYQKLRKYDLAIADYTKALELEPAMGAIVHGNRGYCYKSLGKPDLAAADFTKALELDSHSQDPLLLERGRMLVDLGDVESAEKDFNKALEFPGIRAQAYSELAYIAIGRQDVAACISLASKAIETDADFVDGWVNRGACEIMSARFAEAVKDLSTAVKVKPDYVPAYLNRSAAYASMRNCKGAREDAKIVAKLDPSRAELAQKIAANCHPDKSGI